MVAVNICFKFKNNIYSKIIDINHSLKTILKFDEYHIPHITILQFYTEEKNLIKIKEKVKKIKYNLDNFIIKKEDLHITKYKDNYIYTLKINSEKIKVLFDKILCIFKNFIILPHNISEEFIENINYKKLEKIVYFYHEKEYNPHITIGFCEDIKEIIFDDISIENKDIEIDLFYIGDYGSALPINFHQYYKTK